jgi:hypothetical protein
MKDGRKSGLFIVGEYLEQKNKKDIDNHKNIVYYVPSTLIHAKKGAIYGVFRKYTNLSTGCGRD